MADPLSILREYVISKRPIVEKDGKIIFGTYSWPKTVKTNYASLIWESKKNNTAYEYYTLECLVFLMKHVDLPHPSYCRKAQAENVPYIKRPDRKGLLNYLRGVTSESKSINEQFPTVFPTEVKTEPGVGTNVYIEDSFSVEVSSSSLESGRNSESGNYEEIKTEPDEETNIEGHSSNMGSTSFSDRNSWSEKNIKIKTEPGEDRNGGDIEAHSSMSSSSDNRINSLSRKSRKNINKFIPKKKSQSREEIFKIKRENERKHYGNKNDSKRLAAYKEKDKEKYLKERERGVRKSNFEMKDREKRQSRKSWHVSSSRY